MTSLRSLSVSVRSVILVILTSASLWLALVCVAHAEIIRTFDVDIKVSSDSSFVVTETILYDFEGTNRHGIYRNIKERHPQPASVWYKDRYIDYEIITVSRDGKPEPYQVENYDGLSLKIGDPKVTISGPHTYALVYRVSGGLAVYDGQPELYWNVTGNEWNYPIQSVSVHLSTTEGANLGSRQFCYVGYPGDNKKCESSGYLDTLQGKIALFTEKSLSPGEELTIAQQINLPVAPVILERVDSVLAWLIGLVVWFVVLGTIIFRWQSAYRPPKTIIAQYEPYENFKPMFTGVLFDNVLNSRDITAGILYLAQQGYFAIKQTTEKTFWLFETTDYEIALLKSIPKDPSSFDDELAQLLFLQPEQAGKTIKLSDLKNNQSKQRKNFTIIQDIKKSVTKELVTKGFLEKRVFRQAMNGILVIVMFGGFISILGTFLGSDTEVLKIVLVGPGFISIVAFLVFMDRRRTRKGFEARYYLEGFKQFLSVTDKDRYKFHNAPDKNPQQFMEYLPYAIAFGVEKEWAEVFKDIQIDAPSWYSSDVSGSHFNAASFTSDLGAFASSFGSSTGASGSSGSGGGGSSGGGGGGGGGGSW